MQHIRRLPSNAKWGENFRTLLKRAVIFFYEIWRNVPFTLNPPPPPFRPSPRQNAREGCHLLYTSFLAKTHVMVVFCNVRQVFCQSEFTVVKLCTLQIFWQKRILLGQKSWSLYWILKFKDERAVLFSYFSRDLFWKHIGAIKFLKDFFKITLKTP